MDLRLDLRIPDGRGGGTTGVSQAIFTQVRLAILSGRLPESCPLPAARNLAQELGVSRTTVDTAYDWLVGEGLVARRVGAGTFVADSVPTLHRPRQSTSSISATAPWEVAAGSAGAWPRPVADRPRFDFRPGIPDAAIFPHSTWKRLVAERLTLDAPRQGVYGSPRGRRDLRRAIAMQVAAAKGMDASEAEVLVTNGTQQAFDLLLRVFTSPDDLVAIEDPGYPPLQRLVLANGRRPVHTPVDSQGLVVDALPPAVTMVFATPSHQFPLGVAMSLERRLALLRWADATGAAIVEDDYDSEFRHSGALVEPLRALDTNGRVLYVGSFSKTMSPGIRLGYLLAPEPLMPALVSAKSLLDWHAPLTVQGAMADFMVQGHYSRHLARSRRVYQRRYRTTLEHLSTAPDLMEPIPARAGLQLATSVTGMTRDDLEAVIDAAASRGVAVHPLHDFTTSTTWVGLLLGFGNIDEPRIRQGLDVVHGALRAVRSRRGGSLGDWHAPAPDP